MPLCVCVCMHVHVCACLCVYTCVCVCVSDRVSRSIFPCTMCVLYAVVKVGGFVLFSTRHRSRQVALRDDGSEKPRPNFRYDDSDPGTVTIVTEGTCKVRRVGASVILSFFLSLSLSLSLSLFLSLSLSHTHTHTHTRAAAANPRQV